jgi:hypothetical protein
VRTYYAARPIDTPSTPPPPVPVPQPYFVPQPYYVPQPCVGSGNADPGWTQELDEFSQE